MRRLYLAACISTALCGLATGGDEQFSVNVRSDCVGVVLNNAGQIVGTGFVGMAPKKVVTCAHVAAADTNLWFLSSSGAKTMLTPRYTLPRYDVAILEAAGEALQMSLPLGDIRRLRPGDKIIYLGYDARVKGLQANQAIVTAVGNALNDGAVVEFIEFDGVGVPGYSGGPVFDRTGKVVAIMREAWTKRGIKGGSDILVNRAYSVGLLSILSQEVFSGDTQSSTNRTLNLLELGTKAAF